MNIEGAMTIHNSTHPTHRIAPPPSSSSFIKQARKQAKLCMDTAQWPQIQELVVPSGGASNSNSGSGGGSRSQQLAGERRARPQKEQALNCPRCNSTNTKFCYYNNYSLTQPRYFCKTCRRYWTEGGSLRNVPVGGGSRKNKRSSSSSSSSSSSNTSAVVTPAAVSTAAALQINPKFNQGRDLNLSFPLSEFSHDLSISTTATATAAAAPAALSAMELLRSTAGRGLNLNPFAPMNSVPEYAPGFGPMHTLNFPLDGGYVQESRLLFPFEDSRPVSNNSNSEHDRGGQEGGDHNAGFWNGMLGGGGGGGGGGSW